MDALRALESMGMGGEATGAEGEKLLQQAEQLWSMLDDMANKDPAAYKRFIEKQRGEHEKLTAPPQPNMCLSTQFQGGGTLYINIVSWPRMPKPQSATDNIPLYAAPLENFKEKKKGETVAAITVAANPEVVEEFGSGARSPQDQQDFIGLTLDYVQHLCGKPISRSYVILPASDSFKGDLDKTQRFFTDSLKKALNTVKSSVSAETPRDPPPDSGLPPSVLSQLANISVPGEKSGQSNRRVESDPPITVSTARSQKETGRKKLIQELQSAESRLPEPRYTLEKSPSGDELLLRVELPGVTAVGECELDISEDDAKLYVEGKYDLMVTLPSRIDESAAWATFNKKQSVISLHMPVVDS